MFRNLLLSLVIVIIASCAKSKHERRISDGLWYLDEYFVDGVDSTQSAVQADIKGYKFKIESSRKKRRKNISFDRIYAVSANNKEIDFGHWGERDDNKMMFIPEYALLENLPSKPFIDCGCFPRYNIEFIDKNEMKYNITYDGTIYELKFKKD